MPLRLSLHAVRFCAFRRETVKIDGGFSQRQRRFRNELKPPWTTTDGCLHKRRLVSARDIVEELLLDLIEIDLLAPRVAAGDCHRCKHEHAEQGANEEALLVSRVLTALAVISAQFLQSWFSRSWPGLAGAGVGFWLTSRSLPLALVSQD